MGKSAMKKNLRSSRTATPFVRPVLLHVEKVQAAKRAADALKKAKKIKATPEMPPAAAAPAKKLKAIKIFGKGKAKAKSKPQAKSKSKAKAKSMDVRSNVIAKIGGTEMTLTDKMAKLRDSLGEGDIDEAMQLSQQNLTKLDRSKLWQKAKYAMAGVGLL